MDINKEEHLLLKRLILFSMHPGSMHRLASLRQQQAQRQHQHRREQAAGDQAPPLARIDAFELADSLDPKRPLPALQRWFEMRHRGGDTMGAAAILSWRLRQLGQLRMAVDAGLSTQDHFGKVRKSLDFSSLMKSDPHVASKDTSIYNDTVEYRNANGPS